MIRKPLELQERARILKLRAKGMSINAISKELHRSKRTVSTFIKDPVNYLKTITNGETEASSTEVSYSKLSEEEPSPKKKSKPIASANGGNDSNASPAPAAKVSLEHRSVIKFLTKKGWNAAAIHDDMKHVYKGSSPSLNAIEFWVKECQSNPSLNFNKGKTDKIWVVKNKIKKAKLNIKKRITKKKENDNAGTNKEKDKTEKNTSNKNLITLKLFDTSSATTKNKIST